MQQLHTALEALRFGGVMVYPLLVLAVLASVVILDKAFVHSTGHGLGLEIHEPPRLGKRDKSRLKAGMAITIEPGVYLEGFGGIRIEDTVLVTEKGCEILTPTSKDLRAI
jgi:Xaa-Pro aminopeptidase